MTKTVERPQLPPLPEVDDATRKEFLIGAAGLLLLPAGCGGGGADGERSGETRTVGHALGETQVPEAPRRVVTLIPGGGVDYLLTYGVVPAAAGSYDDFGSKEAIPYRELVDFPVEDEAARIAEIEGVGCCAGAYNIEKIAASKPDLIVGWDYSFEGIYEQLSEIAPSVAITPHNGPEWIEAGRKISETLGRPEEHERWLERRESRIEELRAEYGDPSDIRVTIANASDPENLRISGPEFGQDASIAAAAGFRVTEPPEGAGENGAISQELIPYLDADVLFLTTNFFNPEDYERLLNETYGANPLWDGLEVVKRGMVFPVDTFFWTNGGPTVNTQVVLPDLFGAAFEGIAPRTI